MNSYLIWGGSLADRLIKINQLLAKHSLNLGNPHPDLLVIEPTLSIGINQIRLIQKFLKFKNYQTKKKAVVIGQAEKLTIAAQNAFLKTLEEPSEDALIILSCQNKEQLIPTIISRCQIIYLANKKEVKIDQTIITHYLLLITELTKVGVGERLKLIEPFAKNREEAIKFLNNIIVILQTELITQNSQLTNIQLINLIKNCQASLRMLEQNINVKLVLDNLVINSCYLF